MIKAFKRIRRILDNKGQTVVEYVLVVVIIVLALIAAFQSAHIDTAVGTQAANIQNTMVNP